MVYRVWCLPVSPDITKSTSHAERHSIMVSSIFDPLGFLAPFVLKGNRISQELCRSDMDWDQPLPDTLRLRWESWGQELHDLANIKIPRCYEPPDFGTTVCTELHYFSDASFSGSGQCSFYASWTLRAVFIAPSWWPSGFLEAYNHSQTWASGQLMCRSESVTFWTKKWSWPISQTYSGRIQK